MGLLWMPGPQEAAASIWRSLWEGGLVGVVVTRTSLLQAYQERSCLLRRQSLCTQATPLLPGSMTEGRLPCKHTWSQVVAEAAIHPSSCLLKQVK